MLAVTRPNQVWASDITCVPMARGFVYLVAIVDWFGRRVLAWRLSITLTADFRVEALEEALARHGKLEIFNTDQGSRFTSADFVNALKDAGIAISMDGRGAWRDNPRAFPSNRWQSCPRSSSASGGRSSTRRSVSAPTAASRKRAPRSAGI